MNLQDDLIKSFAQAINQSGGGEPGERSVYAQVSRIDGDTIFITIDGSSVETPATSMVQVGVGDRVFATIKSHSVVITGNISFPSLTRVGQIFMTLTADGLLIGQLDEDNVPVGSYVIVEPDGFSIYDQSGTKVASFYSNTISIGLVTSAVINFCGGKATMSMEDTTLKIAGGNNVNAIGISNTYGNYKSEVVCEAKASSHRAAMQLLNGSSTIASFILSDNGANVTVPSGKALTENGTEVVKVNGVVATGRIYFAPRASSSIYFAATGTITPPTGYALTGIKSVQVFGSNNLDWVLVRTEISDNTITLRFNTINNSSLSKPTQIICTWFALRTSGVVSGGDTYIDI